MRGLRAASILVIAAGAVILPGLGPAGAGNEVDLPTGAVDGQVLLGNLLELEPSRFQAAVGDH